jgi:hypothetical protein
VIARNRTGSERQNLTTDLQQSGTGWRGSARTGMKIEYGAVSRPMVEGIGC